MNLVLEEEARAELREAVLFDEASRQGLGHRFLDAVESAFERIRERPRLYRRIRGRFRRYLVHGFPYGVLYAVGREQIFIAAVMHLHREPEYWLKRRRGRRPPST